MIDYEIECFVEWVLKIVGALLAGIFLGVILHEVKEQSAICDKYECYKLEGITYKPEEIANGYIYLKNGTPCIKRKEGISCNYNKKLFVLINGGHATTEGVERVIKE